MKRPRRKKAEENLVKKSIEILDSEITQKFNDKPKLLNRLKIHKNKNNKYHKMFLRIIEYLDELNSDYTNPIECLIEDYLTSIYEIYKGYGRSPKLINFSPSINNKIQFIEWISKVEKESEEEYWVYEKPKIYRVFDVKPFVETYDISFIET